MKRSIIKQLLLFFLPALVMSTISIAQKPQAYEMMVDGVKVIVQPTIDEIVDIRTVIKGGVQNYPANKSGIESLAIKALTECGTANDDKNSFKNKLDKAGARIYGGSNMDFASVNLNCLKEDLDKVWQLYADALTAPQFDEKEFDRIKQDQLNLVRSQLASPDFAIQQMAKEAAFAGKNYAKNPMGTEQSLKDLTAAETKEYYKSIANKNRIFMVVVGNLERGKIASMANAIVSQLPQGQPFNIQKEGYAPKAHSFKSEKKELATNYVEAFTSAPPPGTPDFNAFQLAMNIMYDRHFLEVRSNNGLSYAPFTFFNNGLTGYAAFGASTTEPNKYIQVVNKLIDKTKTQGFTEEEARNIKTRYITSLYYNQETNAAQAGALASNEVLHNNWRRAITLNDDLKSITAKDLSTAFNKYINHMTWVYRGDPAKVDPKLYTTVYKPQSKTGKLPPSGFSNKKINK